MANLLDEALKANQQFAADTRAAAAKLEAREAEFAETLLAQVYGISGYGDFGNYLVRLGIIQELLHSGVAERIMLIHVNNGISTMTWARYRLKILASLWGIQIEVVRKTPPELKVRFDARKKFSYAA